MLSSHLLLFAFSIWKQISSNSVHNSVQGPFCNFFCRFCIKGLLGSSFRRSRTCLLLQACFTLGYSGFGEVLRVALYGFFGWCNSFEFQDDVLLLLSSAALTFRYGSWAERNSIIFCPEAQCLSLCFVCAFDGPILFFWARLNISAAPWLGRGERERNVRERWFHPDPHPNLDVEI